MQVDIPDQVVELLRDALTPVIERLIDEKVQEKRPLLLSVSQVAEELSCSRASVYGLIRGGHLEAIQLGRTYKVPSEVLLHYVEDITKPKYQRIVVSNTTPGISPHELGRQRTDETLPQQCLSHSLSLRPIRPASLDRRSTKYPRRN